MGFLAKLGEGLGAVVEKTGEVISAVADDGIRAGVATLFGPTDDADVAAARESTRDTSGDALVAPRFGALLSVMATLPDEEQRAVEVALTRLGVALVGKLRT